MQIGRLMPAYLLNEMQCNKLYVGKMQVIDCGQKQSEKMPELDMSKWQNVQKCENVYHSDHNVMAGEKRNR